MQQSMAACRRSLRPACGRSNVLNVAMEARFMAQSTATMSPAFSAGDALFFCIGVRPMSHVTCCMAHATVCCGLSP